MGKALAYVHGKDGVWVIYMHDNGPQVQSYHVDAVDAIKAHNSGYDIAFWPEGTELRDAINDWERRGLSE